MKTALRPLTAALLLLAALRGRAADGRIPISAVPYTITAPGHYYLTQDLAAAGGTAVTIGASDVTLDLNGHTLSNTTSALSYDIQIGANLSDIEIHGGTLRGGRFLVTAFPSGGQTIRNLTVREVRFLADNTGTGTALYLSIGATQGLYENLRVERCEFLVLGGANSGALSVYGGASGRIADNLFRAAAGVAGNTAINLLDTVGFAVTGNRISGTFTSGIAFGRLNTASAGNRAEGNEVQGCQTSGLALSNSDGNTLRNNSVVGCTNSGILVSGGSGSSRNLIEENLLTGNGVGGLTVGGGTQNVYGRNRAMNNGPVGASNYSIVAGNRSAGDNCDQTVCNN